MHKEPQHPPPCPTPGTGCVPLELFQTWRLHVTKEDQDSIHLAAVMHSTVPPNRDRSIWGLTDPCVNRFVPATPCRSVLAEDLSLVSAAIYCPSRESRGLPAREGSGKSQPLQLLLPQRGKQNLPAGGVPSENSVIKPVFTDLPSSKAVPFEL